MVERINFFESLKRTTEHTLNYISETDAKTRKWTEEQIKNIELTPGESPYIKDGYWWIGDINTNVKAEGKDGIDGTNGIDGADGVDGVDGKTPYIKDGNWWIGDTDTGVLAQGPDGKDGANGQDGFTPYIGENNNWWIESTDTGVKALGSDGQKGRDGETPYIGTNGNWWIGDTDTGVKAEGVPGEKGQDGYTPQKYVDYYTETERADIVQTIQDEAVGDLEASLDYIISIQEELLIPDGDEVSY